MMSIDGDEHTHESEETRPQRIESSNIAGIELILSKLFDSLAHNQQQMLETQTQKQQQMLESLTTCFNQGLETQAQKQQRMLESLTTCFNKGLETQAQKKQHLLESLTTCFNKGLEEALKHQNKPLANQTGEKKVKADDGKKQKTAENAAVLYVVEEYTYLFGAAIWGEWDEAKEFFKTHPDATTKPITTELETTLHIAIRWEEWKFVENMVNFVDKEVLEIKEKSGLTALHMAASVGNVKAAKSMVKKNGKLVKLRDNNGNIPLETAISNVSDGQNKTVEYLYIVTRKSYPDLFTGPQDVAISIVKRFPDFAMEKLEKREMYVLALIVCRPFSFFSGTKLSGWERLVYSLIQVDKPSPYDKLDCENHPAENKESVISDKGDSSDVHVGDEEKENNETDKLSVASSVVSSVVSSQLPIKDVQNPLDSSEGQKGDKENENHDVIDKWSVVSSDVSLIVSSRFPVRDEENPLDSSDVQVGGEENPLDSSNGHRGEEENENGDMDDVSDVSSVVASASKIKEMLKKFNSGYSLVVSSVVASASKIEGMLKKFISRYIMAFYTRVPVPLLKRLYDDKLMYEQAVNLVKEMLQQIIDKTNTETDVIDFLKITCVVNTAIKYGITEFIEELLETFPFVISHDLGDETMIQIAIAERNEKILNLILETGKDQNDNLLSKVDENGNSVLHYAAQIAPSYQLNSVSGAALQMQRETQWYKGIENMVHPFLKHMRNSYGYTAQHIFTEQHKQLVATGEKWMKDTSGSCMVVATLIATVAFAAAFAVPGGNISDLDSPKNGFPVFLDKKTFAMFAVADAVALFSSITSVIMFLAIITSRYAEEDFLKSLPHKLIIGLATLFLSMASILVAFDAAFTLVLRFRYPWAPIPIAIFGLISVLLFAFQEFPLFLEMVSVTYWPQVFTAKNCRPILSEKESRRTFKQTIKRKTKKDKEKEKEV